MQEYYEKLQREVKEGKCTLGIELGSTRIKAVLIDSEKHPAASGSYSWENRYEDGVWTYSLEDIRTGIQEAYADLARDLETKCGEQLRRPAAIGISAMMHGYMAFDQNGELLVPFRTWRNTMTQEAAEKLTALFSYNIPQRWSIAHLYQAMLNKEAHLPELAFFTTLAGYIHWILTGEKVLGIGDASGMFPIDSEKKCYDEEMLGKFEALAETKAYPWKIREILPAIRLAGESAGNLTAEGAAFLDVSGNLEAGVPLCPPEGDAGTGMAATNAVAVRTGNVSAGTSIFAMAVLEHALKKVHTEIDLVTTPDGAPVAMVHCNNCTSDINAWMGLLREFAETMGFEPDMNVMFEKLFHKAMESAPDCGGLLSYCFLSGEPVAGLAAGRPMFVRTPSAKLDLANFMRTHIYGAIASLALGMDILFCEEDVKLDRLMGHGGLFKTKGVGQQIMADAMGVPVSVMETAGEGGAWGIALLAAYLVEKKDGQTLPDYLNEAVFSRTEAETLAPDKAGQAGFAAFLRAYRAGLPAEGAAVSHIAG
ncbi:MAG: FGGY-family carbohydrate kinase [Eubacteriales bacterium]|nr:FGGY-family carbohydrate kinase [Eubacteriales bacterium]